jgi:hypothetical protein
MAGAVECLGQMSPAIAMQRDWHRRLSSSSAAGFSSPFPCTHAHILWNGDSQDEREGRSCRLRMNIHGFSLRPCQTYMVRPTTRSDVRLTGMPSKLSLIRRPSYLPLRRNGGYREQQSGSQEMEQAWYWVAADWQVWSQWQLVVDWRM